MFDALLVLGTLALELYTLIDAAKTESSEIRTLPKWAWILIILFFGLLGPIAWLIAGRPAKSGVLRPSFKRGEPRFRQLPPDDNDEFLRKL